MSAKFRLGLIINPLAGIGGSVALKGSDGKETADLAKAKGARPFAQQRCAEALKLLKPYQSDLSLITVNGDMGGDLGRALGFEVVEAFHTSSETTSAEDTWAATEVIQQQGVDLLLFAGGDGTARDVCAHVKPGLPVLGIPAGCKIHSGVYAVTPVAAGRIVERLLNGELLSVREADVMDIDEQSFRQGRVRAKRYGEMEVPSDLQYLQSVKMGGKESEELVLHDIAADIVEQIDDEHLVMGSGSTVAAVMEAFGLDNTLLGVDLVADERVVCADATEQQVFDFVSAAPCKLVITLIGGQGHLFGRGNQQLSPRVIRAIGRDNVIVVATKTKLQALDGRPLVADTGDTALDQALSGLICVVTGYHDKVLYPLKSPE